MDNWYKEYRAQIEKYFTEENKIADSTIIELSPSNKYRLEITKFKTGEKSWDFTRGIVSQEDQLIGIVMRNYYRFPFTWTENHPNGHDYLICGEHYQGQTVIELDTKKRSNFPASKRGFGFCWINHYVSPNGKMLAVEGCHWADAYETQVFDFTNPLKLPYNEIARFYDSKPFPGWSEDNTFITEIEKSARKSDGKFIENLTDTEYDAIESGDEEGILQITVKFIEPGKVETLRSKWG